MAKGKYSKLEKIRKESYQNIACTTAGLSYGAGGAFVAGTASANAITLATASSSSGLICLFKLQNISLKQTIPAYQRPGTYTLPVTVTVVAQ